MNKYIGTAVAIITAGILAIIIAVVVTRTDTKTWAGQPIADEAVKVLTDYKEFRIATDEAKKKIGYLSDRAHNEEKVASTEKEKTAMLKLAIEISVIESRFILAKTPTSIELDEAINAIKKIKP